MVAVGWMKLGESDGDTGSFSLFAVYRQTVFFSVHVFNPVVDVEQSDSGMMGGAIHIEIVR